MHFIKGPFLINLLNFKNKPNLEEYFDEQKKAYEAWKKDRPDHAIIVPEEMRLGWYLSLKGAKPYLDPIHGTLGINVYVIYGE